MHQEITMRMTDVARQLAELASRQVRYQRSFVWYPGTSTKRVTAGPGTAVKTASPPMGRAQIFAPGNSPDLQFILNSELP